jgi:hypothetical protein
MAMTEQEWLACTDPELMMKRLTSKARRVDRQWRLFVCACVRRVWPSLTRKHRTLVELAEQYADGLVSGKELKKAHRSIWELNRNAHRSGRFAGLSARFAAGQTANVVDPPHTNAKLVAYELRGANGANERQADSIAQAAILRDIFGNPFRPVALNPTRRTANVTALAQSIYDERAFDRLPILADALEDAGCDNADILNHCRQPGEHVRGCWVVDLLLGKD